MFGKHVNKLSKSVNNIDFFFKRAAREFCTSACQRYCLVLGALRPTHMVLFLFSHSSTFVQRSVCTVQYDFKL